MQTKVFDMAGKQVGEIELSDAIFGIEPNESVVHDVVKNHLANCRQGTQSALTRAEVSGGGIKPWRQKGTGRARQGSIRAPQWYHGGIVFAPKPRDYSYTLNKKVKRLALKSVLSAKASEENVVVIDEIKMDSIFDQGAGLLSNVMYSPFEIVPKSLISQAKAQPFQTTFNRQIHTMENLYGKQLEIPSFTRELLAQMVKPLLEYYPTRDRELIADRVCETVLLRQKCR